jgi:hypothetical protein
MAVISTLRLSTLKPNSLAVDERPIISAFSKLQVVMVQDSSNALRQDQSMAEGSNKPMNAFMRDRAARSRLRLGVKVKPLMDITTMRLSTIGNAGIAIAIALDVGSMGNIIRSIIAIVGMSAIHLCSTKLLVVSEVGLVSRGGKLLSRGDSRSREWRNLVVEWVDMASLRERNMKVGGGLGADIENLQETPLIKGDLRNLRDRRLLWLLRSLGRAMKRSSIGVLIMNHLDRSMVVEVDMMGIKNPREVGTRSLRIWTMAMETRLDGVRGRGRRSIERKLPKNGKRGVRRSIEKRDGRKGVVGSLRRGGVMIF